MQIMNSNKYIFGINSVNGSTHPYPELEQIILDYLDPAIDYKQLVIVNKYYHDLITKIPIYRELKSFYSRHRFLLEPIYDKYTRVFVLACTNKYLEVAKYLFSKFPSINIHTNNEYAFRLACACGYLDIVKYLCSLDGKINIFAERMYAFKMACEKDYLDVIKYLTGLNQYRLIENHEHEELLRISCNHGHIQIAEWLLQQTILNENGKIDIYNIIYPILDDNDSLNDKTKEWLRFILQKSMS